MSRTYSTDLGIDEEIQKYGPAIMKILESGITSHRKIMELVPAREIVVRKLRFEMFEAGLIKGGPWADVYCRPVLPQLVGSLEQKKAALRDKPDRHPNKGTRDFESRISMKNLPERIQQTIGRMHNGGWPIRKIADYLSGVLKGNVSESMAMMAIQHYCGVDQYLTTENANSLQRHYMPETDMGGRRIQMTLAPFRSAGSHVEW